jgi:hypothetical protein
MIKRYKSSFNGVTIDPTQLTFVVGNLIANEFGPGDFTAYEGQVSNIEITNVIFSENPKRPSDNSYSFDYLFDAEENSTYAVKSTQGMPSGLILGAFQAYEVIAETTTTTTEPQNIWDSVTQEGLVLHFDINSPNSYDGSSTLSDLSQGGNTGNIVDASYDSDGGSLFFNSTGYVSTTYQIPIMNEQNDFTWDIWLKVLDGTRGDGVLIGKRYFAEQNGNLKFTKLTPSGMQYYANNSSSLFIHNVIDRDSWKNVCIVKSGNYLKYYYDTSLIGTSTLVASDIQIPFYIGGDPINGEYTKSKISVVRVYDRSLTESEILSNYNITCTRYGLSEITTTTTTTTTEGPTTTTTTTIEPTTTTTTTEKQISEYTLTFKTLEYGEFKPIEEPLSVELFEENFAYLKDFINYLENEVNISQKSLDELEKIKSDLQSRVERLEGGSSTTTTTTSYTGLKIYNFQSLKDQNSSISASLINTGDWNGNLEIVLSSFTYDGPVYYIKKDGSLGYFQDNGSIMLNTELTSYLEIIYYPETGQSAQGDLEGSPSWDSITIYEEPTTTTTTTEEPTTTTTTTEIVVDDEWIRAEYTYNQFSVVPEIQHFKVTILGYAPLEGEFFSHTPSGLSVIQTLMDKYYLYSQIFGGRIESKTYLDFIKSDLYREIISASGIIQISFLYNITPGENIDSPGSYSEFQSNLTQMRKMEITREITIQNGTTGDFTGYRNNLDRYDDLGVLISGSLPTRINGGVEFGHYFFEDSSENYLSISAPYGVSGLEVVGNSIINVDNQVFNSSGTRIPYDGGWYLDPVSYVLRYYTLVVM